ncbi:MAG TPA: Holliday junction branch migration protein RuvA [Mycobacteriales bacterium]|nr:Holliday junction branch migration protein RuvA [Mycobacteriales bacterium]
MIASVHGQVAAVSAAGAVVEVGGVGLAVSCTPGTLARLRVGQPARLSTSLVVREDSLTLYGFSDDDERSIFELLLTASGVGPRLAQAVLSVLPPTEVRRAVATADVPALTRVPGIGKKGAERLVLELRDKIGAIEAGDQAGPGGTTATAPWRDQVGQALVSLGWTAKEADEAVTVVAPEADGTPDVPALLRAALRVLSPR